MQSTPVVLGTPLRPRICVGHSETLAFQIAACPSCKAKFRLMWPCYVLQIPLHRVIYLDCPLCAHSLSLIAIELASVGEGGDQFICAIVLEIG